MTDEAGDWRRDPTGRNAFRFWDGADWTEQVSNHGVRTTDPYTPADAQGAPPPPPVGPLAPPRAATPTKVGTPRFNRRRGPTASRGKTIGGTVTLIGGLLTGLGTIVPIYSAVDTTYFKLNSDEGFSRGVWVAAAGIAIAF